MNRKHTLMLILLAWLFATQSQADCSKGEVLKLVEKGFSKSEISSICGIGTTSSAPAEPESKWLDPTRSACTGNGGNLSEKGICAATWNDAGRICSAADGRLPSIDELRAVVTDCGGEIDDYENNQNDPAYQSCYQGKGFSASSRYWSSSEVVSDAKGAWAVRFNNGGTYDFTRTNELYVRCVRSRQ